jgi:hypothetical protein
VLAWHVADKQGNRSANLGGPAITNVDLVLGQGRVAGQAILKDVGRQMLERTYSNMSANLPSVAAATPAATSSTQQASSHAPSAPMSPGLLAASGVFALGIGALGYEVGRRRRKS